MPDMATDVSCAARKRTATMTPTSAQTLGAATETKAAMQNPENDPAMPATGSAALSDDATEHIAAGPETAMSMEAIVTALGALPTEDARAVVLAAQLVLNGKQQDIRKARIVHRCFARGTCGQCVFFSNPPMLGTLRHP